MIYEQPIYRVMGDSAVLVELGDEIQPSINRKVRELFIGIEDHPIEGIVEMVPAYCSLLVVYDPLEISLPQLKNAIVKVRESLEDSKIPEPKLTRIPVVYGGDYGPDLNWVADYHGKSPEEVIGLHTGSTYQVYMIGFTPGYPYMGELPDEMITPRRETPRTLVPKGSVGIAKSQTGIYSVDSPGGWQIIGWTPLDLFDPSKWPPSLLNTGDRVQFYAIEEEELERI